MSFPRPISPPCFWEHLIAFFHVIAQVACLNFDYQQFDRTDKTFQISEKTSIIFGDAVQVTLDNSRGSVMTNLPERAWHVQPFKRWRKGRGRDKIIASFNSTFVIIISPAQNTTPVGEGLAFILTANSTVPEKSDGKWLGIVNEKSNGSSKIVAIEFDTVKSYPENLDDNHIGLDLGSIYSTEQDVRLNELRKATGNFNPKNKLGKGGFGTVYKGIWRNKETAVKRVSKKSGKREFVAEVTTIGNLNHKNLPEGVDTLYWETRLSITNGVAQALEYLHYGSQKRVLNRAIKSSNITLDSEFNAKLGDFGLARTIQGKGKTHHSTLEIAGTLGYMAPETFLISKATVETDIYSFGVLLLEVVCGRKPGKQNEEDTYNSSILNWIWDLHKKGRIVEVADPRMEGKFEKEEMECVLILGLARCHPNPNYRPSMNIVLQVITGEVEPPQVPLERPSFVWPVMPPSFSKLENSTTESLLAPFSEVTGR
ncbi:hypothetical protein SLEP1_g42919 [Rubroshorea leprosula]|uniref:Protein kinase domain-containing protein n=1 Tax=Rubroshorea leprosula TaxID=152421 RepID=A0AAV5LCD6_9ROSI|nr:hypothetical protein SLEP1_g42919 [Rubroshorea leprosula]